MTRCPGSARQRNTCSLALCLPAPSGVRQFGEETSQKTNIILLFRSKLPTRNSLIGWAYGRGSCSNERVAEKAEEEWTCVRCTLINKPSAEICDACLTSRPEGIERLSGTSTGNGGRRGVLMRTVEVSQWELNLYNFT